MGSMHAARLPFLLVLFDALCAGRAMAQKADGPPAPPEASTSTFAVARIGEARAMEKYLQPDQMDYEAFTQPEYGSRLIETERWHRPTELRCNDQTIVIRFYGSGKAPVRAKAPAILVTIDSLQLTSKIDVDAETYAIVVELENFKHSRDPIKAICESGFRALVDLVAQAEENRKRVAVGDFHLQNAHHMRNYGKDPLGFGHSGLWIPVGIFATNGKRTDDGIEFVAMPVGLAFGSQWWTSERFFLGASAIGMYSVASTGSGSKDKVSLTTVGAGLLFDLGSWVYLTGTYHWQFARKAGEDDPGFMIGIGPGASPIDFLAGNPQPN